MLKKRIIPVVYIKNSIAVQSIQFSKYLPIGSPKIVVEFLEKWGADEIMIIDLDAAKTSKNINFDFIAQISDELSIPLTYGGGLNSSSDVNAAFASGADKILFNNAMHSNKDLVSAIVGKYGAQAVIGAFDVIKCIEGYRLYDYQTQKHRTLDNMFAEISNSGVGEVFVNSVSNDGMLNGYDIKLCKTINDNLKVPLTFAGGCAKASDILQLFQHCGDLSAAAAGNFYHYTEISLRRVKNDLAHLLPIRLKKIDV